MADNTMEVERTPAPLMEDSTKPGEINVGGLTNFIVPRLNEWERHREQNYDEDWKEYYRLWRGKWNPQDRVRESERSQIITPALQQAVEAQVAEFEEATFSRKMWFQILDNYGDEDSSDVEKMSDHLLEDTTKDRMQSAISEVFLNGSLYGTGIGKVVVVLEDDVVAEQGPDGQLEAVVKERISVKIIPVDPFEFLIDPAAKSIDDAMGVAHNMLVSRHSILAKQKSGMYRDTPLGSYNHSSDDFSRQGESFTHFVDGPVKITEYYGLVPAAFLPSEDPTAAPDEETDDLVQHLMANQSDDGLSVQLDTYDLVEAWVTIANDSDVLRAQRNPFTLKDRPFVSYQHDKVANRFWGRGTSEKGYNVQKALDGELRARMDSLALSTYPMMAMNSQGMPRGFKFKVGAGKVILTPGDPNTFFKEFKFSEPGAASFRETGELERMIQMATGSMDSATPIGTSPRNATASGMSQISNGAMKRQKRTLKNIERDFLSPILKKIAYRYMQYDPVRYPFKDYTFSIKTGLGIVARELEQQNLVQLLQTSPPNSPGYYMTLKNVWELSSVESKEEMMELTDKLLQQSLQPQPNPEMELRKAELELKGREMTLKEEQAAWDRSAKIADYHNDSRKINQRSTEYAIDMQKVEAQRGQWDAIAIDKTAGAIEKLAKASAVEGAANRNQIEQQVKTLESLMDKARRDGEEERHQATTEFMGISNRLQEQADLMSSQEPIIKEISAQPGTQGPQGNPGAPGQIPPEVLQVIEGLKQKVAELESKGAAQEKTTEKGPVEVDRDERGLIRSIGGRQVKRDSNNLIKEI